MDLAEEQALLERIKEDPEAFGILFDAYYRPIFNYILKRVAHFEVAEDLTSEVFYKAVKSIWKFRWRHISFKVWLYRIANNQIIDWYRTKKHISLDRLQEESGFDLADVRRFEKELLEAEEKKLSQEIDFVTLHSGITELPSKYQEVIVLKYFEKKKLSEIGEILNKKEGTVKSLISRGLDKLKIIIEKNNPMQLL